MVDRRTRPIVSPVHADEVEHRRQLAVRANASLPKDGTEAMSAPLALAPYAAADLPDATLWEGSFVYISDEGTPGVSDGAAWDRFTVGAIGTDIQAWDELLQEIANLSVDPNADSGLFFDDSAGNVAYWTPTTPLSFSGTSLVVAASSDTVSGVIEIAVQSEMETATDTVRAVVPGRQQFHPSAAKFWIKCDNAGNINASYNITSISDVGTGSVAVTIATDFSSANYSVGATVLAPTAATVQLTSQSSGSFSSVSISTDEPTSVADVTAHMLVGFGDQ